MRTLHSFFLTGLMLISISSCGQVNHGSKESEAKVMLLDFYTNYITLISEGPAGVSGQSQIDSLTRKYCTEALLMRIPAIIEKTESDPFLKAQDSNIESLKSLTIRQDEDDKNQYVVLYRDVYTYNEFVIHVTLVKDQGGYKIDAVW
jgi:hypothetical protein